MSTTTITYWMPLTKARLSAAVTTTADPVLGTRTVRSTAAFTLVTVADPDRPRSLTVDSGFWRDYAFTLGLTEDGRLTSAGLESTGQGGTLLAAAATVAAGAAAALAAGNPIAAVLAGAGLARAAAAEEDVPLGYGGAEPSDDEKVLAAYEAAQPGPAARLAELVEERVTVVVALDAARRALRVAAGDPATRFARQQELATLKTVLAELDPQLDAARVRFAAWRDTTLSTTVSVRDELVPLSALPAYGDGKLAFGTGPDAAVVREFFDRTGRIVATAGYEQKAAAGYQQKAAAGGARTDALCVSTARPVQLVHCEGAAADDVVATAVDRALVLDQGCAVTGVPVRRSWFGKRRSDVTLSGLGALTAVSYNGTSAAAGAARAVSELPGRAAGALDELAKGTGTLDALRARPEQLRIDAAERDLELARQRLLQAGQAATATDYAAVERLTQQKELAELRAALAGLAGS